MERILTKNGKKQVTEFYKGATAMKKLFKSAQSLVLALCLCVVGIAQMYQANAITYSEVTLDDTLAQKMEAISDSERIDVSVWVRDINQDEVKEKTKNLLKKEKRFSDEQLEIIDIDFLTASVNNLDVDKIGQIRAKPSYVAH